MSETEHGIEFENDAEKLLSHKYIADFVARSPMIQFGKGKPEELADAVLVLGDKILAFQCKSRKIPNPNNVDDTEKARIQKKIQEGVRQLKTIRRALNQNLNLNLINKHGIQMRSSFPKDAQVVGIVLINLFCETDNLLDNLELSNGYDFQHDMPIHIMMAKDFLFAAEFFDTMPDLLEYLDNRYVFHKNKQIHPEVLEKDFVVFHKTKYDKIKEYLENPTLGIHIKPGFADDFFSDNQHALYLRNENLKFSYLVDEIIDSFRSSIGFNPADEEPEDSPHINEMLNRGRGSEEAYKIIITELGMLSRLERKLFAESLLEKAKKADQVGFGYRIIIPNNDQTRTHFFLFCYKGERIERLNFLDAYLCMACVQHSGF